MIFQEDRPGLRSGLNRTDLGDVLLKGVLGNAKTQLEQFPTNPFGTPEPIVLRHLPDQGDGFRG